MNKFKTAIMFRNFPRAFDPGKNGWKIGADGKIEMKDGNPVYIKADGSETVVDVETIGRLNAEAKTNREAKEAAEKELKKFDGITDPALALKAIETVSKLDAKKLIDAGEVDKLTDQIKTQFTAQLTELTKANSDLQAKYDGAQIGSIFTNSEFVRERVAVPRDMFEASFRQNFKIEDGKITAYDRNGNRLMSKKLHGEFATPDEALELLVEMHPQKDTIVKAAAHSGSGNSGGGGGRGGGRYISRSDFEKLNPIEQTNAAASAAKGELTIND